jgi:hypothetical protein
LIGLGLSVIGAVISLIIWGFDKLYYITGIVGLILLGLCVVLSGSLGTGDKMRANYATETSEDRLNRDRFVTNCLFISIPNLFIAGILYFLSYKGLI